MGCRLASLLDKAVYWQEATGLATPVGSAALGIDPLGKFIHALFPSSPRKVMCCSLFLTGNAEKTGLLPATSP